MHRPRNCRSGPEALSRLDTTDFEYTVLDDAIPTLCILPTDNMSTLIDDGEDGDQENASLICTLSIPAQDHSSILLEVCLQA